MARRKTDRSLQWVKSAADADDYILTQFSPVSAVYVEGLVALVDLPNRGVKHQAVGAQLCSRDSIVTFVELITLSFVVVLAAILGVFGAGKLCTWKKRKSVNNSSFS